MEKWWILILAMRSVVCAANGGEWTPNWTTRSAPARSVGRVCCDATSGAAARLNAASLLLQVRWLTSFFRLLFWLLGFLVTLVTWFFGYFGYLVFWLLWLLWLLWFPVTFFGNFLVTYFLVTFWGFFLVTEFGFFGYRVWFFGYRVWFFGYRVWFFWLPSLVIWLPSLVFGYRVWFFGYRVWFFGYRVWFFGSLDFWFFFAYFVFRLLFGYLLLVTEFGFSPCCAFLGEINRKSFFYEFLQVFTKFY